MSTVVTGTRLPVLRRPMPLATMAPWIALFLPLFVYNIGFSYVGSGDTVPAELAPIAIQRQPRPDVCGAIPQLGDCSRAGWRAVVEKPAGRATEHVLVVELKAPNGRVRRLGPIRFRWEK